MAFTISSDVVADLEPVALPNEASLVKYDQDRITWPSQGNDGAPSEHHIKLEEIVLVAESSGGSYLILTLSQGEQDADEPFKLLSFITRDLPQGILDRFLLKRAPDALKTDRESSLDVIVSVRSGTGQPQKFYNAILKPFLKTLGVQEESYNTVFTKDANSVKEYARERWGHKAHAEPGVTNKKETVILLSGDGGIVDLLNGNTDPPGPGTTLSTVALIPLGTGNALFHSLHRPHYAVKTDTPAAAASPPHHLALALRALLRGWPAPLPTFQASFSEGSHLVEESSGSSAGISRLTGAIVASYGFHSQLVWESDTPAYRRHGDRRFGMVARELLEESHAYSATVETSGSSRLETSRFSYILATMVSNLEKTFTISPDSRPLDGQLRLVHFGAVDGEKTMEIMTATYNEGSHVGMKWTGEDGGEQGVGYEAVEEVRVTTLEEDARWRKVCIDGTIVEIPRGGSMTVKKSPEAKIQVLVLDA